jgi:hypothetical protein
MPPETGRGSPVRYFSIGAKNNMVYLRQRRRLPRRRAWEPGLLSNRIGPKRPIH